jgi:hypothetical protein
MSGAMTHKRLRPSRLLALVVCIDLAIIALWLLLRPT